VKRKYTASWTFFAVVL